jgi:hypothetical protein
MPNSIQFNEHMFLFIAVTLALTCIVYGLIHARKRPPDASQKHWMAYRRCEASVCAEEQAEQIIEAIWPEEVS